MADKEKTDQEEPKKSNKMLFIIIGVAVLLAAGVGVGAYLLGSKSAPEPQPPVVVEGGGEEGKEPGGEVGPMVDIEEFIVNLQDSEETRYLKAAITLEVDTVEAAAELDTRKAQIKDAILLLISAKTYNELRDLQGKLQLRAELMAKLNSILQKGKVRYIYFTNFVVQ